MTASNAANQPSQTTTITLTSPPNSRHLTGELQIQQQSQQQQSQTPQAQQQQQPIYYVYPDTPIDNDTSGMDFEGHVAHTAQAAPITVIN